MAKLSGEVSRVALKLSIFTTAKDPQYRGDLYHQAIRCYTDLADEVVVINGGQQLTQTLKLKYVNRHWPYEFDWKFFGEQFQRGYKACTGDWVIKADLDYIFHENDHLNIRKELQRYNDYPAVTLMKRQLILPDRYNVKSRLAIAVNKKKFGDRIKFDGGGDLCQPTLDGVHLNSDSIPNLTIPFWNYEKILKTKEQIAKDVGRMERAWFRHFGEYQLKSDGTDESAFDVWYETQLGKLTKAQERVSLEAHPMYMIDTIKNLKPEQFGYSMFGREENSYVQSS